MLFVHLAREELVLSSEWELQHIPYVDLERVLPAKIVSLVERSGSTSCCIINGPWGFTPLRIGTVIINLLQQYTKQMQLFPISKIDLYRQAVASNFLPHVGLLWIGQKKNMLMYNFTDTKQTLVSIENYAEAIPASYFIDRVVEHPLLVVTDPHVRVTRSFTNGEIILSYQWATLSVDPQNVVEAQQWVFPEYLLAPSIG